MDGWRSAMTAFGFGEEFDDGQLEDKLSEAVDRARGLLRNLQHLGSESVTRPAGWPFAQEHHEHHEHPGHHGHHGHAEAHASGRSTHSEPGPDDEPGEPGEGGGWGGPWG